jgi:3-keto-5-aminohexanoate cleavage enzyme
MSLVDEVKKVFDATNEPTDETMGKKLIINIAANGSFVDRRHNPNLPYTANEVAKEVAAAYKAGAAMWHFHPRDLETGITFVPLEKRLQIHKEWCDAVFKVAPDIITDVGAVYVIPPVVQGGIVDETSILAETRVAPFIDRVTQFGPNNRYVEVGIVLCHTAALGRGTNLLSFNNRAGVVSDVELLQSRGIRVEISPFKHSDIADAKEWVIETGIAQPPVILDALMGVHNSPNPKSTIEALEWLLTYARMMPKGVLWQVIMGGRYWLPLTVAAIMLGADIVRIGMEDAVYMYPHANEHIKSNEEVVETIAGIAKRLGREIATPAEARKMLGLLPIQK